MWKFWISCSLMMRGCWSGNGRQAVAVMVMNKFDGDGEWSWWFGGSEEGEISKMSEFPFPFVHLLPKLCGVSL